MKKSLILIAVMALTLCTVNAASKKVTSITLGTSQGFQGPEWENNTYTIDKEGYIVIFDGTSLKGWRGYGKNHIAPRWVIEDGCLHFRGGKNPKSLDKNGHKMEGGDIVFGHKFGNCILELEWKISKGGNSGIFYLAQETTDANGKLQPIYISCPEYQVLDNVNHPDAKKGKNGNRQSASLYDMIPAKPQNANPHDEWNKAKIIIQNGKITHIQNNVEVLTYQMWTPEWTEMLQNSKFSEAKWPVAFNLLNKCGGKNHEGLIGLQDHGDDVWYRNIRVKVLP